MANFIVLTQASASAPAMEGVNGAMNAVLNFCLTHSSLTNPWVRDHNDAGSFTSIWRAANGNRFPLYCRHDSAVSGGAQRAVVRGCESAAAYNSRTDEFPTAAQVADTSANWLASSTADGTDRNWTAIVTDTWIRLWVKFNGTNWEMHFYGDVARSDTSDAYNTVCISRNSTGTTQVLSNMSTDNTVATQSKVFWARDIAGGVKSSRGSVQCSGTALGTVTSAATYKTGYLSRIMREKIALGCIGSSTTTPGTTAQVRRGWLPNLWQPQHGSTGAVVDQDTATDSAYSGSALFRFYVPTGTSSLIEEESDTWSIPSG